MNLTEKPSQHLGFVDDYLDSLVCSTEKQPRWTFLSLFDLEGSLRGLRLKVGSGLMLFSSLLNRIRL